MSDTQVLLTGLTVGESPRWHDGRLWLCNWGASEVVAVDPAGESEVVCRVPTEVPFSIDWLPDGRLLVVSGEEALLLRRESDGSLITHADLGEFAEGFNEIVLDARGNAYVNGGGFDFATGAGADSGVIILVRPDGTMLQVADGIHFGNGMAIMPDDETLIVAESWASRLTAFDIARDGTLSNRRVWADLGTDAPDGICVDAEGAVWYASVPNLHCVRIREGGEVLQTVATDLGCFACMLGGDDGRTLFVLGAEWNGVERMGEMFQSRTGRVLTTRVPVAHAGHP